MKFIVSDTDPLDLTFSQDRFWGWMGSHILLFISHLIKTKCYANATVLFPGHVVSAGGYLWDMISKYLGYSIFLNILSFTSVTQTSFSMSRAMAAVQGALNSTDWYRASSSVPNRLLFFFSTCKSNVYPYELQVTKFSRPTVSPQWV